MRTTLSIPVLLVSLLLGALAVPLALPSEAAARVRDSSARTRPSDLGLADVNGDGLADWVGLEAGLQDAVKVRLGSNQNFYITRLNGGWQGGGNAAQTFPMYTFTGRFRNTTRDDVCVLYQTYVGWLSQHVVCFQYDVPTMFVFGSSTGATGGEMTPRMPTQLGASGEWRGYTVGDFDGDGYDEILTYNKSDGTGAKIWRYSSMSGSFVAHTGIDLGNLAGLNWAGGIELWAGEMTGADANGARRDDLLAFNRSTGQVALYGSAFSGGRPVFWWFYTSASAIAAGEDIAVANADGDFTDDLIAVNRTSGAMRFRSLTSSGLPALAVTQGNLPSNSTQPLRLMWASLSGGRDQPVAVFADNSVAVYWPVTDAGQKTYWWGGSYGTGYIWSRIK